MAIKTRAPSNKLKFTKKDLDDLPLPAKGKRATYHDHGHKRSVNGLQLRVTSNGTKTFYVFQRVNGKPERIKVGEHPYPTTTIAQARQEALALLVQIGEGESPAAAKREQKAEALTLAEAVGQYLAEKRRTDGLPLKQRTHDDYMAMVTPGRLTATGKRTRGGTLAALANKPIHSLTASDIKKVHAANLERGERQAIFAMQTLRAVLRWHGVTIPHDPFSLETHGRDRIILPKTRASDPAPVERLLANLGIFWRALIAMPVTPATDYIAFLMLTGCRAGEPRMITVADCDLAAGNITLRDTKNRSDHVLRLSRQALVIVERAAEGKAGDDRLFPVSVAELNKVAHELVRVTGMAFVPKMARSLFASVAEELTTAATLKRLMNHKQASDIAGTHYIRKQEEQLRAGWQAVADFIEEAAKN